MEEELPEKTLLELNREAYAIDDAMRRERDAAADAAREAVVFVLKGGNPDVRRIQKDLRPGPSIKNPAKLPE